MPGVWGTTRTRGPLSLVEPGRRCLQAADLFEQGMRRSRIAEMLGVTRQAVHVWHRAWEEGGRDALLPKRPGGSPYLSAGQEKELDGLLRAGATASGFEDQRSTLARVRQVVQDRFGVMYSVAGAWFLLDRLGWSWQVPARCTAHGHVAGGVPSVHVKEVGGWVCFEGGEESKLIYAIKPAAST
ncbi:helix-turn-helix domain-containing protein [Streptomyces antibioticus]|uniref:helix-turn-helix domain-containing protein n=1 Tax=Streptomyces antibioticus TaxID=1890 RepID=UPI0033D839AC